MIVLFSESKCFVGKVAEDSCNRGAVRPSKMSGKWLKVRKKSGNFEIENEWQPWAIGNPGQIS